MPSPENAAMNKAQLVESIARDLQCSRMQARRSLDAVCAAVRRNIRRSVTIADFGTFLLVHRKAHAGTHPRTGRPIRIAASKTVKFKIGKAFRNSL